MDNSRIADMVRSNEGYRADIYLDTNGNWTGGWGTLLKLGMELPKQVWDILFLKRFDDSMHACNVSEMLYGVRLDSTRRAVIIDMAYALGRRGVQNYKKMWKAIQDGDFNRAGDEIIDSAWHLELDRLRADRSFNVRTERLAEMMRKGENNNES